MDEKNEGCLETLNGKQLTAVAFVLDYLRLEFEALFLTVLSDPSVESGGRRFEAGKAGFRDALCERISQTLSETMEEKGHEIRLTFSDGSIIRIPLNKAEASGTEAATLQLPDEGMCVWHFE